MTSPLKEGQIAVGFPSADGAVVLAPLVALEAEEFRSDGTQGVQDNLVLFKVVECFGQGLWQQPDATAGDFLHAYSVHVAKVGFTRIEAVAYAVQSCCKVSREG